MSDFVDRVLRSVLFEEPAELVAIIPKQTGPGSYMSSRTKGTLKCFSICYHYKIKFFIV